MKTLSEFFKWFWEEYLGENGQAVFVAWTVLVLGIFLTAFGYFFGWAVIAYFFGIIGLLVVGVVIVGWFLLIRDAWLEFQARLFDKLRGGPAKE